MTTNQPESARTRLAGLVFMDRTLDLRREVLVHDGAELRFRPRTFGVLSHLLTNAGRVVTKQELPEVERRHRVIATKLLAGRTLVHVHADARPGPEFEPVDPDLEDVYFSVMAGHQGARAPRLEVAS